MSDPTNADADAEAAPHAKDDDVTLPESQAHKARKSELLDESLEETFPASDPPTAKHIT